MTDAGPSTTKSIVRKIFCNYCGRRTNHLLKAEDVNYVDRPGDWLVDEFMYRLWACAGCDHAMMEVRFCDSVPANPDGRQLEDVDPYEIDEELYTYAYYPELKVDHLLPKKFAKLNSKLERIYRESISCFNAGSLVLCSAGLRSLLEGVCQDKKVKGRTLEERIENLQFLLPNKNIIRHLHHFRFTGNKAMHELEAPSIEDVRLAIDVIQDLLNYLYELDYKASKLSLRRVRRIPPDRKQKTPAMVRAQPDNKISKPN